MNRGDRTRGGEGRKKGGTNLADQAKRHPRALVEEKKKVQIGDKMSAPEARSRGEKKKKQKTRG